MTLQERDYTIFLNDEERVAFELEEKIENRKGVKNNREFPRFSHPDESVREFIWHRRSLFPNNYLHLLEYKKLDFDDEAGLEKALLEVMCVKCETDSLMHLNYIIMQNSINLGQYPVLITMQDYESDIYDIINVEKDNLDRIFNIKDGAD